MAAMQDNKDNQEAQLSPETDRFLLDLEFLLALANPVYLRHLATHENHYFTDDRFLAYLKYLQYFKKPEYVKFVKYPHALYILDLLQDEDFRNQVVKPNFVTLLLDQQNFHWKFYRAKRLPELLGTTPTPAIDDAMQTDTHTATPAVSAATAAVPPQ